MIFCLISSAFGLDLSGVSDLRKVTVILSTSLASEVNFRVEVSVVRTLLEVGKLAGAAVTPSTPHVWMYEAGN